MRIGIISPPWLPVPPPGYGGTELVIDVEARGLLDRGHDVIMFTTGDATIPVPRHWEYREALGTERFHDIEAELRHLETAYERLADCDVIHDHSVIGPRMQRVDVPVVTTMHGTMEEMTRRWCQRYPDNVSIVAISASQRDSAPEISFTRVIHHGIELAGIETGAGDGGYLLFLGRMSPDKGVHRAIEVAREAGMPLRIAAKMKDADEREYFTDVVKPMLSGNIEYCGEADSVRKCELLQGAQALLNPLQWREPFGMVMIESLAVGTPVITTRCGAAPEIVEHGRSGYVCDSTEEMVAACERVRDLSRMDCRRAVEERFTAARMITDHENLFRDLVRQDQGRRAPTVFDVDLTPLTDLRMKEIHLGEGTRARSAES